MKKLLVLLGLCAIAITLSAYLPSGRHLLTKVELGERLFFDSLLSRNNTVSCATCHKPEFAFADTLALTPGVYGRKAKRNTPSAMNLALQATYFWDGRAKTLEQQALMPIENPDEMDTPVDTVVARLNESAFYREAFMAVFNERATKESLAKALAAYQRTLETNQSVFDEWRMWGDDEIVNAAVKRGFVIFNTKGKCVQCHFGADFNNPDFRNIGLFDGKSLNDSGRGAITKKINDIGRFKIGPLRNIAITAPYMHNGMFKTLKEVINFYNDPSSVVPGSINRDSLLLKPLGLSEQERSDLEEMLRSLTDKRFVKGGH